MEEKEGRCLRQEKFPHRRVSYMPTYGWYILPFLIMSTTIVLFPLAYSLWLSFYRFNLSQPYLGQSFVGLANYYAALRDPIVLSSIKITFKYVLESLAGEFLIGFALALLMMNRRLRGLSVFRFFLIIPLMLTPVAVGLVWKFFYSYTGLVNYILKLVGLNPVSWFSGDNALLSVVIVTVWRNSPFVFLVLLAGMQTVPPTLIEAARIDGASYWQIFSRITLPLISSFIIIILVIRTTNILRHVDLIFALTFGGPGRVTETLSFLIYTNSFLFFEMGYGSALSFLLIGVTSVIIWGYMRFRMRGE